MPRPGLKKRFGQHHLRGSGLCRPLLEFLRPEGRTVVEVGPGGGVLTADLVHGGARVLALEIDPEWALRLARVVDSRKAAVVVADALRLDWRRVRAGTLVAGNLPYNVATAIIDRVLAQGPRFPRSAFLVQREVAERLVAEPGEEGYGAASVLTAVRARRRLLGRVSRGSFRPPPKVEGAFIGLTPVETPFPAAEMARFNRTVHLAFAQRRKTLRNSLAAGWGRAAAEATLAEAGIDPRRRAEELSPDDFSRLHEARPRADRPPGSC